MKNKVISNASWMIGCRVAQGVLALIVSMLTARYLGPSNFGLINYAASIVAFVTPFMQLGLTNVIVQEFIQHPEEEGKILGSSVLMSVISSFFCIIGVVAFALIINTGETETIIVCFLYSLSLVFQAIEIFRYWFQAKYISQYASISSLIAFVVMAIYKFYLLASGKNVYWFAISYSVDYIIICGLLYALYKKKNGSKLSFSKVVSRRLIDKGKYYIISNLMVAVFAQTDKIMIKNLMDNSSAGLYSAAVYCAGLTSFVFTAICDAARPWIFEKKEANDGSYERSVSQLYCVIIYFSLAQSLFMTLFSKVIIHILYGSMYYKATSALMIVVWYTTFSYLGIVRNIWILAEGQQKYLWIINVSGALANVILNAFLIPMLGINGAALASLITQFFTNVIVGYMIPDIRKNNYLMVKGLNISLIKSFLPSKE